MGISLKKIIHGVTNVAKVALPFANFIPGVNLATIPLTAAAAVAAGLNRATGDNASVGNVLGSAALGGAEGYAGAKGAQAVKGAGGIKQAVGKVAMGAMGGQPVAPGATPDYGAMAGSLVKRGAGWLASNPGVALAGVSALNAARQGGKAGDFQQQALDAIKARQQGFGDITNLIKQRLSQNQVPAGAAPVSLYDPGNPYSRR